MAGVVCDPSWLASVLLSVEHLVTGVKIKERPGDLFGLVFESRPAEVLVVIEDAALATHLGLDGPLADRDAQRALLRHVSSAAFSRDVLTTGGAQEGPLRKQRFDFGTEFLKVPYALGAWRYRVS